MAFFWVGFWLCFLSLISCQLFTSFWCQAPGMKLHWSTPICYCYVTCVMWHNNNHVAGTFLVHMAYHLLYTEMLVSVKSLNGAQKQASPGPRSMLFHSFARRDRRQSMWAGRAVYTNCISLLYILISFAEVSNMGRHCSSHPRASISGSINFRYTSLWLKKWWNSFIDCFVSIFIPKFTSANFLVLAPLCPRWEARLLAFACVSYFCKWERYIPQDYSFVSWKCPLLAHLTCPLCFDWPQSDLPEAPKMPLQVSPIGFEPFPLYRLFNEMLPSSELGWVTTIIKVTLEMVWEKVWCIYQTGNIVSGAIV